MNIYVYKVEGIAPTECVGVLDTYSSLNFTKSFQGCGSWTLKGNFTADVRRMLHVGNLIYISPRVSGIIHSVDFSTDESGVTTYTAYGYELKGILGYRIVWDTYNHSLSAADWLLGIVRENAYTDSSRRLFQDVVGISKSTTKLDRQTSYTSLLEALENACGNAATTDGLMLGFDVTCDTSKGFTFRLLAGDDRTITSAEPVLISRDMNNVSTLDYVESNKDTANVVKAGGEGEGSARKFVTSGDLSLSGMARREHFEDCRELQSTYTDAAGKQQMLSDSDYLALLRQEADGAIVPDSVTVDAETAVDNDTALSLLGAKVTLIDRAFNARTEDFVSEVNIIDEADGQLITITVGKGIEAKSLII